VIDYVRCLLHCLHYTAYDGALQKLNIISHTYLRDTSDMIYLDSEIVVLQLLLIVQTVRIGDSMDRDSLIFVGNAVEIHNRNK